MGMCSRQDAGFIVVTAVPDDEPAWLALAAEAEPLFGSLVNEPTFRRALQRNIGRGSAFCVRAGDGAPGAALCGGILFSAHPPQYTIGWLVVARLWQRRGVGRALVEHVLRLAQPLAEVSVVTFGPDQPDGAPARRFYERLGFVPAEMTLSGPDGQPRQVFRQTRG